MIRAAIFGVEGTLGRALATRLPEVGYELCGAFNRAACNIVDVGRVREVMASCKPQVVFNAAAYTNVDRAEDEPDDAFRANAIGPEVLARACHDVGAKLIHYSTDFVFDGEQPRSYDEFDPTSPMGLYGRSKVAGEQLAMAASPRVFVMRVGCLYGAGGRNFPSTILRRLRAGETIRADRDRVGSPTWVIPVATASGALGRTEHFGLYHCTAHGETSWADYSLFLADELGLPPSRVEVLPTTALGLKAPRPRRAILDNRMLRLRGLDSLGDWKTQARAYLASELT